MSATSTIKATYAQRYGWPTREKDSAPGAGKVVFLMRLAHVLDAAQRHVQNHDLDEAREGRGDHLRHEHGPWWDLHVVAELQVGHEAERLGPLTS